MAARRTTKTPAAVVETASADAPAAPREDIQLLLARSLFRADKWDPERDANAPFEWEPQRSDYLARAARLIRLLDKDGMEVTQR